MNDSNLNGLIELEKLFNFGKLTSLTIAIAFLWLTVRTINRVASQLAQKFPARRLLLLQVATVLSFGLYIFGGTFLIYGILSPPKELMIAFGGSAAVAIGFALKDLVSSLVAGLILLFDPPFQVGDRVTFNGTYGEIKNIGLRAVRIITLDDNLVTIPNSRFISDVVASGNSGALDMMVCTDFYVALHCDINSVRELIHEIVVTSRYAYLKKPVSVIVSEKVIAERLAIELKAKAYVLDVKYEKAFQTDIVSRVETAFKEMNVPRPFREPALNAPP